VPVVEGDLAAPAPETAMSDTATSQPQPHPIELADAKRRLKAIFVGSVGNLVEWYDFYAYTAFSLYFAPAFFPSSDPVVQQLNAATLFAAGFIVRPLGGWLFGHLADRYGRRLSLTVSVLMMCFGSLIIALTPTYATIGFAAPALLALARIIEGLSLGGEYGASATYLSEIADPEHRGFYSSFQYVTLIGGQLTAILVLLLLQNVFLTHEQLVAWGWRIPFVIGALLAITAMFMRRHMHETESFTAANKNPVKRESSIRGLMRYPREVAIVVGLTAGGTAAFYTFTTYMQTFVRQTAGFSDITTTYVIAGSLIFAALLQPIYGAISDRIGRKPMLIFFGVAGTLLTVPLLTTLAGTKSPWVAFLLISGAWVFVAGYTSINAVVKAELFPTSIRATGVAVPYALTVSIFGGTAPAIALFFKQQGHEQWFYYYLAGVIFVSLLVYSTMRDTKHDSAMHRHD
jgi:MHS family alpha-ketoglutarate permease-like MFS transporter